MAGFREWREHKYIRKEGNRYIYPEDLQRRRKESQILYHISKDRKIREAKEERDRLVREAQEQTRRHENSLLNRIDKAGKAAGKAITDAGNAVGEAAKSTYKKGESFITDLFGEVDRRFRKATKRRDEELSKEDRAARQYEANYKRMMSARKVMMDMVRDDLDGKHVDKKKERKATEYYMKTEHAFKNAPGTAGSIGADLEKKKEDARKKRAKKEARKEVIAKIFEKPKRNAQNPFDKGDVDEESKVKGTENKAVNGKDKGYPSSISKRKAPNVNTRHVEKTIKENIIPEKTIKENVLKENTIKEKKTPSYLRPDSTNAVGRAAENNYKSAIAWYNAQRKKGLSDAAIRKLPKFNKYANALYGQMGKLGWTRTPNNIPKKRPKVNNNVQTWDNSTTTWDNVQIKAFEKKRKKSK